MNTPYDKLWKSPADIKTKQTKTLSFLGQSLHDNPRGADEFQVGGILRIERTKLHVESQLPSSHLTFLHLWRKAQAGRGTTVARASQEAGKDTKDSQEDF